tara:strand:+ start:1577 stop:1870 length:294 start_codon:yes stop_codon:yes gene_type:complete
MEKEWLVIDKMGDHFYYYKIEDMVNDLGLTKSQIYNEVLQSLKHFNKYTNRGYYIQRLYNDNSRTPKYNYKIDKYIYYVNDDGTSQWGVTPTFVKVD